MCAAPALAGPVAPGAVTLAQPDGTPLDAVPYGDEWDNGYETADGYTIVQDGAGVWSYAVRDDAGRLAPSGRLPGKAAPAGIAPHLRAAGVENPNRYAIAAPGNAALAGNRGEQPVLLLLVQFTDRTAQSSPAAWHTQFFGESNSASHYYREVSYGQLTLGPAREQFGAHNDGIIGWLTLDYPHPNTAGDTDNRNQRITRDAIMAADPYIDFHAYDANADGYIAGNELHLVVIVAGYETSYGGASAACQPSVWGHNWALGGDVAAPTVDGVRVGASGRGGYSQFGEWHCMAGDVPGHMATMGIMVHEMGHDIDWPDLYDVDYTSNGVGLWSIMSGGSWGKTVDSYHGAVPSHPDAFLKWYQGWLTPSQVIGEQAAVAVPQAETTATAVQLLNNPNGVDWTFGQKSGSGQYFLLENRQQTGYDAGLPGCGILIWHIDETRTSSNMANATDSRRLVDLEEADGRSDLDTRANKGDAGDPFPGSSGKQAFNSNTSPSSKLYGGSDSGVSASAFSGCSSVMTVDIVAPAVAGATATPTRTRTPTRTSTPSLTPTLRPTRTPGGPWWTVSLPVVLLGFPVPGPTATLTRTPTATRTPVPTGWVTILNETFEGVFPGPWQVYDGLPNKTEYYWGKRACRASTGQYSGWAVGGGATGSGLACGSQYPNATVSVMRYGPFSLAGATRADVQLKAWLNIENWFDLLCLKASSDGATFYGECISSSSQSWFDWGIDLSNVGGLGNLVGAPAVWIEISLVTDEDTTYTEGAYVDDIVIRKCVDDACQ